MSIPTLTSRPALVLPDHVVQLTITTTKCPHQATSRYTPPTEFPGTEQAAAVLAEALRVGWAVPDEPGLARVAVLIARDAGGYPHSDWIVPNAHGFHWLRNRLELVATHIGCPACDPMRIVQVGR